jgi:hypothetical protein
MIAGESNPVRRDGGSFMSKLVVDGATLQCNMGTTTSSLSVSQSHGASGGNKHLATVDDYTPNTNISSFGMCQSQANPQVASATAAAQGVLTPQPCNPVVTARWDPGCDAVKIKDLPALKEDSKCKCQWNGQISITDTSQTSVKA